MSLDFFVNSIEGGYLKNPNDSYREFQQDLINELFDNTTAKYTIKEQDGIGTSTYHDIEVWLDYIVGMTSSGVKNGIDFTQIMFQELDHQIIQGRYYIFDNNYHISYFDNRYDGVERSIAVRRCNNVMKMVDPRDGSIFSIPCVIDYDMSSPSQQVSRYIITPNNHASVIVQGNNDTLELFKLNTRFMFSGRPFKLLAYQNALLYDENLQKPTILYLDLYLDEIHAQDDIENNLAYNGEYNYTIEIDSTDMGLTKGDSGQLTATILLDGVETNGNVIWSSSNEMAVVVKDDGRYYLTGDVGDSAIITATLGNNALVQSSITISIVNEQSINANIVIDPMFDKIRQYETITFSVKAMYGDMLIDSPTSVVISLAEDGMLLSNDYLTITQLENQWEIQSNAIIQTPQILYITIENDEPMFTITQQFPLKLTSMFG